MSSPSFVVSPLLQATHRSDVRTPDHGGPLPPFAFSVCVLPCDTAGAAANSSPRRIAPIALIVLVELPERILIATHPIAFHPPGPKAYKTQPAAFARSYS